MSIESARPSCRVDVWVIVATLLCAARFPYQTTVVLPERWLLHLTSSSAARFAALRCCFSVEAKPLAGRISDLAEVAKEFYMTDVARCLFARGQVTPLAGAYRRSFTSLSSHPPLGFADVLPVVRGVQPCTHVGFVRGMCMCRSERVRDAARAAAAAVPRAHLLRSVPPFVNALRWSSSRFLSFVCCGGCMSYVSLVLPVLASRIKVLVDILWRVPVPGPYSVQIKALLT